MDMDYSIIKDGLSEVYSRIFDYHTMKCQKTISGTLHVICKSRCGSQR